MYKIAVIFPSRGLVFSKTAEELLAMLKDVPHKIFFSHKLPIPDCFEVPLTAALESKEFTHILIVEDDMMLRPDALTNALATNKSIVTYDYPINDKHVGAVFKDITGKVIYCGTGFLLIERSVFNKLNAPYFRTDVQWSVTHQKESLRFIGSMIKQADSYGLQDITFCMKLHKAGYDIHVMPEVLGQRKLIALGKTGTNNGAHRIDRWRSVTPNLRLNEYMSMPDALTAKSQLITLETENGFITTDKTHAGKLVEKGIATQIDSKQTAIDLSELTI